jgi:arsenate reductase (thioredoxin)
VFTLCSSGKYLSQRRTRFPPVDWKSVAKTRVLFLCIGNACRSPMAEGFARTHGSDVLEVQSAGLAPALAVVPLTHHVMLEKNIDLGDCYPKELEHVEGDIDLIINMSGHDLPERTAAQVEVWEVRDPIGESDEVFRQVRDEIEQRVLQLIERVRSRKPAAAQPAGSKADWSKVDTRRRPTRQ